MIFFNQYDLSKNTDLIEIKDKEMVDAIKKDFYQGCGDVYNPKSPQICGSVVPNDKQLKGPTRGLSVF